MKKNLMKIIALIISIASLVSIFGIFTFAVEPYSEEEEEEFFNPQEQLLYNRTFDDGWEADNGGTRFEGSHELVIDYEEADNSDYNYFARLTHANEKTHGITSYSFGNRVVKSGKTIVRISIMADDVCDLGHILGYGFGGDKNVNNQRSLLLIDGYDLYAFNTNNNNKLGSLKDGDWIDVTFIFDWSDNTKIQAVAMTDDVTVKFSQNLSAPDAGLNSLYIGFKAPANDAVAADRAGMGFCYDNLEVYQGSSNLKVRDNSNEYEGIWLNTQIEKTVPIYKNAQEKTPESVINESLFMKIGVNSALVANERVSLDEYVTPSMVDGEVMIPLIFLIDDYMGYTYYRHPDKVSYDIGINNGETTYLTIGRDTATVAGELVALAVAPIEVENKNGDLVPLIALSDIPVLFPGWCSIYDEMGLAIVHEDITEDDDDLLFSRDTNLDEMLDMMKKFVFDTSSLTEDDAAYNETGNAVYEATKINTQQFTHPYLITDQETFDNLADIYAGADSTVKTYLEEVIAGAIDYYNEVAEESLGEYVGIIEGKKPVNEFYDGKFPDYNANPDDTTVKDTDDGYNPTTLALYEIEEASAKLVELAFAYQITGEGKYALLAYDLALALGEWLHWGPGYFINCATASANVAIAYDWIYNYIEQEKGAEALKAVADIIYNNGVYHGLRSVKGEFCKFSRTLGYGDRYNTRHDYWNAIGTYGMVTASLVLMEYDEYKDEAVYLIGNNIHNFVEYGLDWYAPDGAYIDSLTYWAYGTNAFMKLVMSLQSAAGNDFGFKDTWALNQTFYYVCYMENANGDAWNYGEDGVGTLLTGDKYTVDTQMFFYAADLLGDAKLITLRRNQIEKGKEVTMFDLLFYPDGEVGEEVELELEMFFQGNDTFITRSGWEEDSLFTGIMGGANSINPYGEGSGEEKFGQIDSGNFFYENAGVRWIGDLGSDNIYADGYNGSDRFKYFRNSAEGHNVVILVGARGSVPAGQHENGNGNVVEVYYDENGNGSYAILDNSNAYGSYSNNATRGIYVNGDKTTVVLQDEVSLTSSSTLAWVVNTAQEIIIDETGKTAYLINDENGTRKILRATLLTKLSWLEFEVLENGYSDAGTPDPYILASSLLPYNTQQFKLDGTRKLVINVEQVQQLSIAVVFEMVSSTNDSLEVGYEFTDIALWKTMFEDNEDDGADRRGGAIRQDIITSTIEAQALHVSGVALSSALNDFYQHLTNVEYTLSFYPAEGPNGFAPSETDFRSAYRTYGTLCDIYNDYKAAIDTGIAEAGEIISALSGR